MAVATPGFSAETVQFLRGLQRNNSKQWFDAHRDDYERAVLEPARLFVVALGDRLQAFAPLSHAEPRINGSIRRLNRDIRFSKDKRPYKDHLDLSFPEGREDMHMCGVGYFMRIGVKNIVVGVGSHMFAPPVLKAYRNAVLDDKRGEAIAALTKKLAKSGYRVGGLHYARPPRGVAVDHPRAELLRYNGLYPFVDLPPDDKTLKGLLGTAASHYKKLQPLNAWLMEM